MKKSCITFFLLAIIFLSGLGLTILGGDDTSHKEYLRIHIRANSNSQIDQQVKYEIKEEVIEFLTPIIAKITDKPSAQKLLTENLDKIEVVSKKVLVKNDFDYGVKASIKKEKFPTRTYQNLTLEAGYYDSLIIELGDGLGDNWWCVVYPPLCFTGSGANYTYRSKILEIINEFMKNKYKEE